MKYKLDNNSNLCNGGGGGLFSAGVALWSFGGLFSVLLLESAVLCGVGGWSERLGGRKQARKPATKPLGQTPPPCTTQHFDGGGQKTSLRTTTTPHLPRATPPPFHKLELLSSLYVMYFVLLPVPVMFHSFLSDPSFDSVCQTMRM